MTHLGILGAASATSSLTILTILTIKGLSFASLLDTISSTFKATLAAPIYGASQPYSTSTNMLDDYQSTQQQPPANDQQYITTFFCRALYDYQTNDPSSLSFHKGDIIEVLTQLESGWWDGLLGDERGWFPSNYVAVISDEEAESALSGSEHSLLQNGQLASDSPNGEPLSDGEREWMNFEMAPSGSYANRTRSTFANGTQLGDFWLPEVTQDGRVNILQRG
jgi:son of sevenless-like protein